MFQGFVSKKDPRHVSVFDPERGISVSSTGIRDNAGIMYTVEVDEETSKYVILYFSHRGGNVYHARLKDYEWRETYKVFSKRFGDKSALESRKGSKVTEEEQQQIKEHVIEAFAFLDCHIDVDFRKTAWSLYSH